MEIDFNLILKQLPDKSLSELRTLVLGEVRDRAYARFDKGDFPPLLDSEIDLIAKSKIHAIKAYHDRTKESLYLCQEVIHHYSAPLNAVLFSNRRK